MTELERDIFGLISVSGESKGKAFEALKLIGEGKYDEARVKIEESRKLDLEAHAIQSKLISMEASGDRVEMGLLMVHAQDHYMTTQLARDLIEGMINIHQMREEK
ncbi:MAG: PTS lactose/cellobiose transporter subunit IIA [Clostridium sp.]|uniref:PTS lactose/cellobiose transporter subunit IIA n=1 Tax=Clostridium sp. TaxID=1506 RepID=UPI002FC68B90